MLKRFAVVALALTAGSLFAADPAWIEYGPNGPLARTIVSGDCPEITIDGHSHRMRIHAEPGPSYPVRTCEREIPAGATSASIGGIQLPVQKLGRIAKVALVGDTGCRIKAGNPPSIQDCTDPKKWPFAAVAEAIRAWDPDLVIHIGDYYYREAVCDAKGKCVTTPADWTRWNADFFTPAASLLASTPWIVARGNHENCSRAAEGFFRFLDPRSYLWENVKTCQSNTLYTPPYTVPLGGTDFVVFDSSGVSDGNADPKQLPSLSAQLGLVGKAKPGAWLILHHPFWALNKTASMNATMWTAWDQTWDTTGPAPPIGLVVAGHIHLLELLGFQNGTPAQFVVGNGGTSMEPPPASPVGQTIAGRTISSWSVDDDFGFIAAEPKGDGAWTFNVMSKDGKAKATCEVAGGALTCGM